MQCWLSQIDFLVVSHLQGIYSWPVADIFPLQRCLFLGDELWIPARPEAVLSRAYSYDGSHYPSDTTPFSTYPVQDHAEWIQALAAERSGAVDVASIQSLADKLCVPPFRTVREFASVTEGWAWADRQQAQQQQQQRLPSEKESSPESGAESISRADDATLACHVPIEEPFVVRCGDAERAETASSDEIWAALSREPHPVFGWKSMVDYEHVEVAAVRNLWQQDQLRINIVDSELSDPASVRLPLAMRSNPRVAKLSYIVSNRDARTGLHTDPPAAGAGWMLLVEGRKVWWWITAHDMAYLAARGWSEEALSALGAENGCGEVTPAPSVVSPSPVAVVPSSDARSDGSADAEAASEAAAVAEVQQRGTLASLLRVCDGYLWGRIIVGVCSGGDLVYTPPLCAHAVRTHERALGLGGYSRVMPPPLD